MIENGQPVLIDNTSGSSKTLTVIGNVTISADIAKITKGNYAGNSTVNRAIPHGLGVIPKTVFLGKQSDTMFYRIHVDSSTVIVRVAVAALNVTAMDATNFYVGNATSYVNSANLTGDTYEWVAFV